MIEQDLVAFIKALNTSAGERVHMGNAPQDTEYPVVVLRKKPGTTPKTLGGKSLFTRAPFAIHVLHRGREAGAGGYADAFPIANAIRDALHGFRGTMGDTHVASSRVTAEPSDQSEIDGDKVVRWLEQEVLIAHR